MTALDGTMGLAGWRWVFIIEGAPACALGIATFFYLKDGPASAPWLTNIERTRLAQKLAASTSAVHGGSHRIGREVFSNPLNYVVAYLFF